MEWANVVNGDDATPEQINALAAGIINLENETETVRTPSGNEGKFLGVQNGALAWINYIIAGATGGVTIKSGAANNVALTIQGAEGQAVNYLDIKDFNNNKLCVINETGYLYINGVSNKTNANNSVLTLATAGTIISRNVADANSALVVNQQNVASTGAIFKAQFNGVDKITLDKYGVVYATEGVFCGSRLHIGIPTTIPTATTNGQAGDIKWDSNYIYVCVAANTWKRTSLTTW